MTRRKEMEAALQETATVPTPTPTRHRVNNDVGAIVSGVPGSRRIMLLHRPSWRDLHSDADLWVVARTRAVRLLLGVVEMNSSQTGLYVVTTATASEGYASMLRALTSGVSHQDSIKALDYLGVKISPRRWGPHAGVRRRGIKTLNALQRAHNLEDRTLHQLVDRIRLAFLARVTGSMEGV